MESTRRFLSHSNHQQQFSKRLVEVLVLFYVVTSILTQTDNAMFATPFVGGLEPEQFAGGGEPLATYRKAGPDEPPVEIQVPIPSIPSDVPSPPEVPSPVSISPPIPPASVAPPPPPASVAPPPPASVAPPPPPASVAPPIPPASVAPPIPPPPVVRRPPAPSQFALAKPMIHEPMKPHLFTFEPWKTVERCSNIVTELNQASQYAHSTTLFVVLGTVDSTAHDTALEHSRADKDAVGALEQLPALELLDYVGRLVQCEADPESGRTVYQKFIEYGMTGALGTNLVSSWLSQGTESYSPHLRLDKDGNTLLHLAVMSGSIETLDALLRIETARYRMSGMMSAQHSSLWIISALNHANKFNRRPLDLAPTPGYKSDLRKRFRNNTNFLRKVLRTQNLSSATMGELMVAIGAADNQLQSSVANVPAFEQPVPNQSVPNQPVPEDYPSKSSMSKSSMSGISRSGSPSAMSR